jgi:hypothetical protein
MARKRIYLAGLYSRNADGSKADVIGVIKNIREAQQITAYFIAQGHAVFCPHLDYQLGFHQELLIRDYKENSMAWLEVADEVYVLSGAGLGGGVDAEIARARELGIPVRGNVR